MAAPQSKAGAFGTRGSRAALPRWVPGLIGLALSACALVLAPVTAGALPAGPMDAPAPPTLAEGFPSTWVAHGGTIAVHFMLRNPNQATSFVTTSFSDTLPTGLVLANPGDASGTCIATDGGVVSGSPGGQEFQMSGARLAPNSSCTLVIDVVGTVGGRQRNTTAAPVAAYVDQASQEQTLTGSPASATVIVLSGPHLHVAFALPSVPTHATTTLRFKLRNPAPNPVALTGVAFADQLPANLTVASPSSAQNTCGGTWQAAAGSSEVQLTGATIAPGTECSLTVDVIANSEGLAQDLAGPASSDNGGAGNSAEDSLVIVMPPKLSIQLRPRWVYSGNDARIQLTITNPNSATSLNILVFYVHLSPKLTVADDPNEITDCAGGALTARPGQNTLRFLNGQLPPASSCQVSVTLRAGGLGVKRVETTRIAAIGTAPGSRAIGELKVVTCPQQRGRRHSARRRRH